MLGTKALISFLIIFNLHKISQSGSTFKKIVCDFNEEYFEKDWICELRAVNKIPTITVKAKVIKEIPSGWVNINMQRSSNGTWSTMFNSTQNACELFEGKRFNPLFNMARDWVDKYSHTKIGCPFRGPLDIENAPPPAKVLVIFSGNYLTQIKVYDKSPYLFIQLYTTFHQ